MIGDNTRAMNHTPFIPALRRTLGPMRSRMRAARSVLTEATVSGIESRLASALSPEVLHKPAGGQHCRERIYSLHRVFWCWIWQMLQGYTSCREVVRQVQSLFMLHGRRRVDEGTAAYCRARARVPETVLEQALAATDHRARRLAPRRTLLCGRTLKVVDGSALRAPDTKANRAVFPPSKNQFGKPAFALVKMVVLFALESGTILARAAGSLLQSELRLLMDLHAAIDRDDVIIGDRFYGCYVVAAWLRQRSADLLARVPVRARRVDFRKTRRRLGPNDAIFVWRRPGNRSPLLTPAQWGQLPAELEVRMIRVPVVSRGYRTEWITLVTTLLDAKLFPASEIVEAYGRRWRLEMTIDDLKTTLGMEMLRGQTPEMLKREVLVFLVAHNFIRWVMVQAAKHGHTDITCISFKGTMDALRQFSIALSRCAGKGCRRTRPAALWKKLLETLVADQVPLRPGRQEPRAIKKPNKYPPLNRPRAQYRGRLSRNARRRKANAKLNTKRLSV